MKYIPQIAVFLQALSLFSQPVSRTVYGSYIPVPMTGSNITGVYRQVPIKVDREGNIYIAAGAKVTGPEDDHVYLVKLSPDAKREIFTADLARAVPAAIAVDGSGNTYVVGRVTEGFRATAGTFQSEKGQGFIAKFAAQGGLLWASRISATPAVVAVDPAGDAYVTGVAGLDFVTTPGVLKPVYEPPRCMVPPRFGNGSIPCADGFVAKVSADGTSLIYATLLGGSLGDTASDIAVDANGSAYVVGESSSPDFPVTSNAFEQRLNAGSPEPETDVFLAQLHPTGSRMIRSTFIGGSGSEWVRSVVVDAERNVYVVGSTQSPDFPTTPNAFQREFRDPGPSRMATYGGVFFLKFSSKGPPDYISYYGGGGGLEAGGTIAVDSAGHLYFT